MSFHTCAVCDFLQNNWEMFQNIQGH